MTIRMNHQDLDATAARPLPGGPATARNDDMSRFQRGRRVLVLENDMILADELRRELENEGVEVLGPVATVAEALDLLRSEPGPDAAILDVFLDDEVAYPVAEVLRKCGIPFVLATNRLAWTIPRAYADVPRVEKPVDMRRLARALAGRSARPEGDPA